jgi:hypothetical protein
LNYSSYEFERHFWDKWIKFTDHRIWEGGNKREKSKMFPCFRSRWWEDYDIIKTHINIVSIDWRRRIINLTLDMLILRWK